MPKSAPSRRPAPKAAASANTPVSSASLLANSSLTSSVVSLPDNQTVAALRQGMELHKAGKFAEAIAVYDAVLQTHPTKTAALVNKGVALRRLGRQGEALACFWEAIAIDSANAETWCNAGTALMDLNRSEEAQAAFKTALTKAPRRGEIWSAFARLPMERRHYGVAEAAFKRALALRPDDHATRLQLAALWLDNGKLEQALAAYRQVQQALPKESLAHSGVGQALIGLGRTAEALKHLKHALSLNPTQMPNLLDAHLGLAQLHLLSGNWSEGWQEYEWRRHRTDKKHPRLAGPEWDGSDPTGKTILVYAEQGYGDTLQFLRFIPVLARRGAKIIVVCQKSMVRLAQSVQGVTQALCIWRPLPAYDCHVPLLSLPHKLKHDAEPIPAQVPYLKAPGTAKFPTAPLGTRLRVGLVWAGRAMYSGIRERSVGLEALLPLAGLTGVQLYSLQAGPRAADISKYAHPALIADLSKYLDDFADTAAIIEQLDLVITIDSAVAHLAGALGKPVWVLVPGIPDWRWQRERSDCLWYPTMRLFRQTAEGDWQPAITSMTEALQSLTAQTPVRNPEPAFITADSIFTTDAGKPRFRMTAPRSFMQDVGVAFLMRRELAGTGYEYATRALLDAHLKPGDLFIDVGAHWGIMSLQAVTRWPQQVRALAFEPAPHNLTQLKRWIAENNVTDQVEVIAAAVSDRPGQGGLRPESTMGHSLVRTDTGVIPVVTIDDELAKRPELQNRRAIITSDVEGQEPEVITGMKTLLASGKVAMVIWERGVEYNKPEGLARLKALRATFEAMGFTAWRFASEDEAGPLVPFVENGTRGNVIELAPGVTPENSYGLPRPAPITQPADPWFEASERARALFLAGTDAQTKRKIPQALAFYAQASAIDARQKDLYNNLGVALRGLNRVPAAIACYRRSHALNPKDAGVMSNLANALREMGEFAQSRALHDKALALAPKVQNHVYNAGLVDRDDGYPKEALAIFERALALNPTNPDCQWDRALALLQMGDYSQGFPAYETRWGLARAYKRTVPLPRWKGEPLEGRSIFLHDEQGFGDSLQFARFIAEVKRRGAGKIILECQPQLMRLFSLAPHVDAVVPREKAIPACDVYAPLLSLPGLFGTTLETLPAEVPYLRAPALSPDTAQALPQDSRFKLGLVWAGKPVPRDRSCPLDKILPMLGDPRVAPISLQLGPRAVDLKALGAESLILDMGPYLRDFAETAAVLSQLDFLLTVDTSVAHLAGALGVPTGLLLRYTSDWRWFDRVKTSPWYPSFTLLRQPDPRNGASAWDMPLAEAEAEIARRVEGRTG